MEIIAEKISKKSLFKLLLLGFGVSVCVFCVLCGIAALFGMSMVQVNGVHRYGLEGLIYGILMGPIFAVIGGAVIWCLMAFGLWVTSFFKPLKLTFKKAKDVSNDAV